MKKVKKLKLEDKVDIKIFILYMLKSVNEPLEFVTINDIVLQDEFVGYFDFAFCFSELLESGQIDEFHDGSKKLYVISELGKETLESYEGSLLTVIKERAVRSAMRLMAFNGREAKISGTVTPADNGFELRCRITDREKTLFDLSVHLSDEKYAQQMKNNFDERADIIYRGTLSLLSGDVNFIFED